MDRLPARHFPSRSKLTLATALLLILSLALWQLKELVEHQALRRAALRGSARATFYTKSLKDSLEKYRHLPYVLARDARIHSLLKGEIPPVKVNPHLEDFATATGALIFVLDKNGTTLAASNWRSDRSLIGYNYSFRPYFLTATDGQTGGYYAVGLQTRKPGYFISYPVKEVGELIGVVVVKVDLEPLQQNWRQAKETVMVSDAYGVLILASNSDWTYTTIQPLPERTRQRLRQNQYLECSLAPLRLSREYTAHGNILYIQGTPYLEIPGQLPAYGWRLHYLEELGHVPSVGNLAVFGSLTLLALVFLTGLVWHERRQLTLSRQEARDASKIKKLNQRLQEEIAEHQHTEQHLRQTQRELLQAGKLAALGRMSAAVAHELNQPVTAMRTFLASSKILVARGELNKVGENLSLLSSLTERMASITGQLKDFSRKSPPRDEAIDLVVRLSRVLDFFRPQLLASGVALRCSLLPENVAITLGDPHRVEQVFNNLLQNSLEALEGYRHKEISLTITRQGEVIQVSFADNGPGIDEETLEYLFEPFFTTRRGNKGLGLGLAICYGIMKDLGGTIRAGNGQDGGALFVLHFPAVSKERQGEP